MSEFPEHMLGLATGRYGTGTPARAIAPVADHPDPIEIVDEVQFPASVTPSKMGHDSQLPVSPEDEPKTIQPPETRHGREPASAEKLTGADKPQPESPITPKPPESAVPAHAKSELAEDPARPGQNESPGLSPFPSYADARMPSFVLPELDQAAADVSESDIHSSGPSGHPEPPELVTSSQTMDVPSASVTYLPHESSAAPQPDESVDIALPHESVEAPPAPGLEIGELTVTVTPVPDPVPLDKTPGRRGAGVSASAALRRAGIRRL